MDKTDGFVKIGKQQLDLCYNARLNYFSKPDSQPRKVALTRTCLSCAVHRCPPPDQHPCAGPRELKTGIAGSIVSLVSAANCWVDLQYRSSSISRLESGLGCRSWNRAIDWRLGVLGTFALRTGILQGSSLVDRSASRVETVVPRVMLQN